MTDPWITPRSLQIGSLMFDAGVAAAERRLLEAARAKHQARCAADAQALRHRAHSIHPRTTGDA